MEHNDVNNHKKKFTNKYQNGKGGVEHAWSFILGYISENGYSPTLDEVAEAVGSKTGFNISRERARQLVQDLVKMQRVRVKRYAWRGITIIPPKQKVYATKDARDSGRDGGKVHPNRKVRQ